MKAIRVAAPGGPEVLRLEEIPTPVPGKGEALIRIAAAGVNFYEIYQRTGQYPTPTHFIPGGEASDVVERVGPGVTEVKPGDRVGARRRRVELGARRLAARTHRPRGSTGRRGRGASSARILGDEREGTAGAVRCFGPAPTRRFASEASRADRSNGSLSLSSSLCLGLGPPAADSESMAGSAWHSLLQIQAWHQ